MSRDIRLALALAFIVVASCGQPAERTKVGEAKTRYRLDLEPGDVVFVSVEKSIWGTIASRWSLPKYHHSHVGIATTSENGMPVIVHANGNPSTPSAKIEASNLSEFIADAVRVDVFRPVNAQAARLASEAAKRFVENGAVFDAEFSLASAGSLYCTELVWRALNEGYQQDILPVKYNVFGREVIRLSDIEEAPQLKLHDTVFPQT